MLFFIKLLSISLKKYAVILNCFYVKNNLEFTVVSHFCEDGNNGS